MVLGCHYNILLLASVCFPVATVPLEVGCLKLFMGIFVLMEALNTESAIQMLSVIISNLVLWLPPILQ